MLAIYTVAGFSVVVILLSFYMYCSGYKRIGIDMFRSILAFDLFYTLLVLMIGLAPMPGQF